MARSRRLHVLALLLAGVVAVGGCGGSETSTQAAASTEGLYLEVGGLKYQVQISRYLNPAHPEDSAYLKGLPAGTAAGPDEVWFGVFMRVENDGERPARATSSFEITDTQENTFRPIPLDPRVNVFAYQPTTLQPGTVVPHPDSVAGQGVIQGSLVLFKLKESDLENRPLILHVREGASGHSRSVSLDL